ncbi:Threonine/homoserine/homoserine lactone efflux protein [Pseudomonas syringae pv. actinidiae]|uniref:Threonine/homoserine/homoserine lactone efflux protein n=1 Tax=Pseudomonas syringae pv. actinidiae TaxID=103796 RepID=A0A2V0R0R2_PSESF|nr:Threonine/homoserine/homoserine lactone efflux protein [Pseudomonas syringae pv. actinidiae]GBH18664.1 Threonine/homoserine/homoserine lactone efflux protein [Pseudomonas syringae pv. actinidiae]
MANVSHGKARTCWNSLKRFRNLSSSATNDWSASCAWLRRLVMAGSALHRCWHASPNCIRRCPCTWIYAKRRGRIATTATR